MQGEINPNDQHLILVMSSECGKSKEFLPKFIAAAEKFKNVEGLSFGYVDVTSDYFSTNWIYWTPAVRFYKKKAQFEYFYG